ncbi:hypothetical protein AB0G73_37025 [Streptomyces sp. NPDC020719]|uniref:hypothetical protein n=1 Tax=Streptomyces sp. NPDC020719 TaxID=3154896 RepID=UPI0033EACF2B
MGAVVALAAVWGPSAGAAHGVGDPVAPVGRAVTGRVPSADSVGPGSAPATGRGSVPAVVEPGPVPPAVGPGPVLPAVEADLAYHGHVSLWNGRVGVWVEPSNHGPGAVPDATVRLRFSVPLEGVEELPPGCLRGSPETVFCSTGPMRAAGAGRPFALDLRVAGGPAEVVVNISTSWSGGARDRNPSNNTHRVLAPATGDKYAY